MAAIPGLDAANPGRRAKARGTTSRARSRTGSSTTARSPVPRRPDATVTEAQALEALVPARRCPRPQQGVADLAGKSRRFCGGCC
ncbi:MAG: hypothetical protein MZW92_31700 [Comamonadaceae bacterium]|nr:hypothetical protein [Comamonadaceae bacterium]